jgi:hypothetical protein
VNTPLPLTPTQRQAASLLGAGKGPTETAATVGVSRSTLARWRKREDFAGLVEVKTTETVASVDSLVADGRDAILRLTGHSATAIEEALEAETYVVDGKGNVHFFPSHRIRLKAAELQLKVAALLVNKVEHAGELALSRMTDEELEDAVRALIADTPA